MADTGNLILRTRNPLGKAGPKYVADNWNLISGIRFVVLPFVDNGFMIRV